MSARDSAVLGEPADEIHIALQKVIPWQLLWVCPGNLLEVQIFRFARELGHTEEHQASQLPGGIAEVVALDFFTDLRFNSKFFAKLTYEGRAQVFTGLYFAARKLPLESMAATRLALSDENVAIAFDYRCHHFHDYPILPIH
jgi:hypothetical protein